MIYFLFSQQDYDRFSNVTGILPNIWVVGNVYNNFSALYKFFIIRNRHCEDGTR